MDRQMGDAGQHPTTIPQLELMAHKNYTAVQTRGYRKYEGHLKKAHPANEYAIKTHLLSLFRKKPKNYDLFGTNEIHFVDATGIRSPIFK